MSNSIATIDRAAKWLAEASSLADIKEIHDIAQAAVEYAKAAKLGDEAAHHASTIKLRAERKAGELLAGLEREQGGSGRFGSSDVGQTESPYAAALDESGTTRQDAHRWQKVADVPEDAFEEYLAEAPEPTTSGVLKAKPKWQGDKGVLINTGEDDWLTPAHIVDAAEKCLGGIDLDPCASLTYMDNVPAKFLYTVHDDGLAREWRGTVYMNPPYGRPIGDWTSKLAAERNAGRVTAHIALVPARTDTRWFADFTDCLYCFIRGRLSFGNLDQGAPFPSVAIYWGPDVASFAETFSEHGLILGPVR